MNVYKKKAQLGIVKRMYVFAHVESLSLLWARVRSTLIGSPPLFPFVGSTRARLKPRSSPMLFGGRGRRESCEIQWRGFGGTPMGRNREEMGRSGSIAALELVEAHVFLCINRG